MSADYQLDPVTLAKLSQFGRRRRTMIFLRGICAGIICLLGAMVIIAIPDYLFILTDTARWTLSVAAYLVAIVAVWITCVRMMVHIPDQRELAQLVESVHPDLREDLVSAVELGSPGSDTRYDSATFRSLLQRNVAERMGSIDVQALLPWKLVGWWLLGSVGVLGVCVALLMTPGMEFGKLMARAMFPMANIARVSDVQVDILEPAPASQTVPQGDPVRVLIALDGPDDVDRLDHVVLETFAPGRDPERIAMTREAERRFATTVQIGEEPLAYRIRAGDAVTARYTIDSRHRPYVDGFEKTYHYPEYSRLETETLTEDDGHLTGLEGTEVELAVQTDQPVSGGELRLEAAGDAEAIELTPDGDNRLTATVPLERSGTYRVHLVAAETGFENRFSPRYEISAVPDLAPRVEISTPSQDQILPPDEILAIEGVAEDDLALASVQQMVRVNNGEWQTVELAEDPGPEWPVEKLWDLYDLRLSTGDRIVTKLVASDLAGNRAESDPLHVTVASSGFGVDRLDTFHAKAEADAAARRFVETAREHRESAHQTLNELRNADPDDAQTELYMVNVREAAEAVADQADQALAVIVEATRRVNRGADAHDLVLLHRAIAEARHKHMQHAMFSIDRSAATADANRRRHLLDRARHAFHQAEHRTRHSVVRFGEMMSAELALVTANDLRTLLRDQNRLLRSAERSDNSGLQRHRFARRLGVAVSQARTLADLHREHHEELHQNHRFRDVANRLTERVDELDDVLAEVEQADDDADSNPLVDPARRLLQTLEQTHQRAQHLERDLAQHAVHKRREIRDHLVPTYRTVLELGDGARQVANEYERLADPERRPSNEDQLERQRAEHQQRLRELLLRDWPAAIAQAEAHAAAEEARPDADSRFVADLGNAARALEASLAAFSVEPTSELADHLRDVLMPAVRQLSAGHDVVEMSTTNGYLAELENWQIRTAAAHSLHPRQWDLLDHRFDRVSNWIRQADMSNEAADLLRQIRHESYAREIREHFKQRRHQVREPERMIGPIADVQEDLDRVLALLEEPLADARLVLEEAAPTLAEMLREAAEQARQAEQLADELAGEDPESPLEQDQAAQLEQTQRDARQELADIIDALRQDANVQDPFTAEGRERARDADDATAMIREPANEADQALQQALQSEDAEEQARQLDAAADQQDALAETLEQLAEHFDALEAGEDIADSRAALREAERDLGIERGLDEQYAQAEELSELAALSPEELMARLEQELGQNRPMQRELSSISADAVEQAQARLDEAAEQQQPVAESVASAAEQQAGEQASLGEELAELRTGAEQLSQDQLPGAADAAEAAELADAAEPLARAQEAVEQAAAELPTDASLSPAELAPQLAEQAERLTEATGDAQMAAAEAAQASAEAQQAPAEQAAAAAESAEQAAESAQASADAAEQAAEQVAQADPDSPQAETSRAAADVAAEAADQASAQAQAATESAQQAGQSAEQSMRQAETAQQQAEEGQLAQAARRLDQAQQSSEQSAQQAEQANEQSAQAAEQAQQAGQAASEAAGQVAELDVESPDEAPSDNEASDDADGDGEAGDDEAQDAPALAEAEQAAQQSAQAAAESAQAAEQAAAEAGDAESDDAIAQAQAATMDAAAASRALAQQANELAESLGDQPAQLAEAAEQQAEVQQAVAEAGEDLGRAARHEQRLESPAAEPLGQLAEAVDAQADQTDEAAEQLEQGDAVAAEPAVADAAESLPELADQAADMLNESSPDEPVLAQANDAAAAGEAGGDSPAGEAAEAAAEGEGASGEAAAAEGAPPEPGGEAAVAEAADGAGEGEAAAEPAPAEGMADAEGDPGQAAEGGEGASGEGQPGEPGASPSGETAQGQPSGDEALSELAGAEAGTPLTDPAVAQALARSLDELDRAAQASGSTPAEGNSPSQLAEAADANSAQPSGEQQGEASGQSNSASPAASALSAAAQAQAQSMRSQRAEGRVPGQNPLSRGFAAESEEGASVDHEGTDFAELPDAVREGDEDWGQLPPRLARDLVEGRRDSVSGEYREMVETYFRVIAERSREQENDE